MRAARPPLYAPRGVVTGAEAHARAQVIRKRLNKPLTLAEKARARRSGALTPCKGRAV
jgi:hypothetical protein